MNACQQPSNDVTSNSWAIWNDANSSFEVILNYTNSNGDQVKTRMAGGERKVIVGSSPSLTVSEKSGETVVKSASLLLQLQDRAYKVYGLRTDPFNGTVVFYDTIDRWD